MSKVIVDEEDLKLFVDEAMRTNYFKDRKEEAENIYKDVSDVILKTQIDDFDAPEYAKVGNLLIKWVSSKKTFLDSEFFSESLRVPFNTTSSSVNDEDLQWLLRRVKQEAPDASKVHSLIEMNADSLNDNLVVRIPSDAPSTIKEGMKISKSLKYYGLKPDSLRVIQDLISELIQTNKNGDKDKFYISIHPMDFLTASVNNHNWSSCHSHYGEYRAGPLSYICDKFSIISYLCDDEDFLINRTSTYWNSKKWRMMIHFNTSYTYAFAGRQYPVAKNIAPISQKLSVLMKELESKDEWKYCNEGLNETDWTDIAVTDVRTSKGQKSLEVLHLIMNGEISSAHKIFKSHEFSLAYLDLGSIRQGKIFVFPSCMGLDTKSEKNYVCNPEIVVGDIVPCPICGCESLEEPERMGCESCYNDYGFVSMICSECGDPIYRDDCGWYDDQPLCHDCYDSRYATCDCCYDSFYLSDVIVTNDNYRYCPSCYDSMLEDGGKGLDCSECGKTLKEAGHIHEGDLYCSECFFETYEVCEECGDIEDRCDMIEKDDMYFCSFCYEQKMEVE